MRNCELRSAQVSPVPSERLDLAFRPRECDVRLVELPIPCRRATADTSRVAAKLSMTIRSFSSSDQRRRRPSSTTVRRSGKALTLWLSIRSLSLARTLLHKAAFAVGIRRIGSRSLLRPARRQAAPLPVRRSSCCTGRHPAPAARMIRSGAWRRYRHCAFSPPHSPGSARKPWPWPSQRPARGGDRRSLAGDGCEHGEQHAVDGRQQPTDELLVGPGEAPRGW